MTSQPRCEKKKNDVRKRRKKLSESLEGVEVTSQWAGFWSVDAQTN